MPIIEEIKDRQEWNAVVENSPNPHFTYLYEWMELFRDVYDFKLYPLGYREDDKLLSVFPLLFDGNRRCLYSHAFGGLGGPSEPAHLHLYFETLRRLQKELKATAIEMALPFSDATSDSLLSEKFIVEQHPCLKLSIQGLAFEDVFMKYSKYTRKNVRKAQRKNVLISCEPITEEIIDIFYHFYRTVMEHNQAAVVFPSELFHLICKKLGEKVDIRIARYEGKDIAGALTITFANTVTTWFIVGLKDREILRLNANTALFSDIIESAVKQNLEVVDLGPSGWNTGTFEMKRRFGAEPEIYLVAKKGFSPYEKARLTLRHTAKKILKKTNGR